MIGRRIFAATTAVFTVAGIVTACSGVPDVTFGTAEEDEGGLLPDGGKVDTGPLPDGSGTGDAPKDGPPIPCTPTNGGTEDCDDGVDNDCNGKVDCADTACNPTHACIATPPIGWSLVGESDGTRPACPTDYPTAKDVDVVAGTGTGTCSCACSPKVPSEACNLQQAVVEISGDGACNGGGDVTQSVSAGAAACSALSSAISVPNGQSFGKSTAPAVPPSGCTSATQTTNVPPITAGRTCAPAAAPAFGGGCGVGEVCARKAPGLALCLQRSGSNNACPVTYPSRKTAGSSTVGDGGAPDAGDGGDAGDSGTGAGDASTGGPATVDTRACNTGSCTCNQPACATTVTLYENANCVGGSNTGALAAACAATAAKNFTATAYKSATTGTGCGVAAGFSSATVGSISFTDPTTICCP